MAKSYQITQEHVEVIIMIAKLLEEQGQHQNTMNPISVASATAHAMIEEGVTLPQYLVGIGAWLEERAEQLTIGKAAEIHYNAVSVLALIVWAEAEYIKHAYPNFTTTDEGIKLHAVLSGASAKLRHVADSMSM